MWIFLCLAFMGLVAVYKLLNSLEPWGALWCVAWCVKGGGGGGGGGGEWSITEGIELVK